MDSGAEVVQLIVNGTPRTARLTHELATANSPETARRIFDEFIGTDPSDVEIELGSTYYGWALSELKNDV